LKLVVEAPRKPNRKEVFLSALIIDLETPMLIVVVSVTEHRFRATMNDQASSDKLMVFCIIAGFEEGWGASPRVDQLTKPVVKSHGSFCTRPTSHPKMVSCGFNP